MSDREQKKDEQKKVSKLEVEKTYGEKIHSFIFDQALNFWANLILSGMFNHWAHNRSEPLKLLGNKSPMDYYENTRSWIRNRLPESLRGPKGPATAMANTFTLSIPGHIIMIPSVWLGAKIK